MRVDYVNLVNYLLLFHHVNLFAEVFTLSTSFLSIASDRIHHWLQPDFRLSCSSGPLKDPALWDESLRGFLNWDTMKTKPSPQGLPAHLNDDQTM